MSASTKQRALPFFAGLFVASGVGLALLANQRIRQNEELLRAKMRVKALEMRIEQLNHEIRRLQSTQPVVPSVPLSASAPRAQRAMPAARELTAKNLKAIAEALAAYTDASREYPLPNLLEGIPGPFVHPPSSQPTTGESPAESEPTGERP